jgi:hypothetical protein
MRSLLFALVLGAPLAFGQAVSSPDPLVQPQSPWAAQDFSNRAPQWNGLSSIPFGKVYRPEPKPLVPLGDAKIDPQIIFHPSQSGIGAQQPGTAIAQNQYPGLKYLPIQWPQAKVEPIPTAWPNLQMSPITTGSPQSPDRATLRSPNTPAKP